MAADIAMTTVQTPVRPGASLAQRAHTLLRDRIVSLQMAPGSVIDEQDLMKELGMSRTPIREAIMRLQQENFVAVLPRRGTFVTEVNIGDLAQLSELRCELEGVAASVAARRMTEGDRGRALELMRELDDLNGTRPYAELIEIDRKVHHFLYACTYNKFLEKTLSQHYYPALRIWFIVLHRIPDLVDAVREHKELLAAVIAGDEARAQKLAREHVLHFETEIRRVL